MRQPCEQIYNIRINVWSVWSLLVCTIFKKTHLLWNPCPNFCQYITVPVGWLFVLELLQLVNFVKRLASMWGMQFMRIIKSICLYFQQFSLRIINGTVTKSWGYAIQCAATLLWLSHRDIAVKSPCLYSFPNQALQCMYWHVSCNLDPVGLLKNLPSRLQVIPYVIIWLDLFC